MNITSLSCNRIFAKNTLMLSMFISLFFLILEGAFLELYFMIICLFSILKHHILHKFSFMICLVIHYQR